MKKNYCVIGHPVLHSLSPSIHNALYERYKIADCVYSAIEVLPETLEQFIQNIPTQQIKGFNITMPLKTDILPYLYKQDGSVSNGANTVVVREGKLYGYSTDAAGFHKGLLNCGFDYTKKNIVFIGSGAVSQTLIHDASNRNPAKITVLNRTLEKAEALAHGTLVFADTLDAIARHMPNCDLLVNTTPLGMSGMQQNFADLSFMEALPQKALVCDLIYSPAQTAFLAKAAQTGHKTLNGLPMLIWQAFYAFEQFLGILPNEKDYETISSMLNR